MMVKRLDVVQWSILKNAYDAHKSDIMPFTGCLLKAYFKKHNANDRTIETAEELDALISLCEICKRSNAKKDKLGIEDISDMNLSQSKLIAEDENYADISNLLNQLLEQREQYRLLHIREYINNNLSKRV